MKNFFKKTSCYTTLPNAFAQDYRLSIEARGLGLLIFSLPDDWVFRQVWFYKKAGGDGLNRRKTVVKALNELISFGYLARVQDRSKGKFDEAIWFFDPEGNAQAELKRILIVGTHGTSSTVSTDSACPLSAGTVDTTIKEKTKKEETKKEIEEDEIFEGGLISSGMSIPLQLHGLTGDEISRSLKELVRRKQPSDPIAYETYLFKQVETHDSRTCQNILKIVSEDAFKKNYSSTYDKRRLGELRSQIATCIQMMKTSDESMNAVISEIRELLIPYIHLFSHEQLEKIVSEELYMAGIGSSI